MNMSEMISEEKKDVQNVFSQTTETTCTNGIGRSIYSVFHVIMSLVAIYLSFRCNNGFSAGPFLVSLFFPYVYIVYILATRGTCGIIPSERK
jgi:hypothetical protein